MRPTLSLLPGLLALLALPAVAAEPTLDACLATLRPQALAQGVDGATWDTHTAGLVRDPGVLDSLDYQPEFRTAIWDYLAGLVDDQRVADGRAMLAEHADLLQQVQARHGVDPATVVAVWGVESDYGRTFGSKPLLGSLATLSCEGRRQAFFRGELFATLRLIASGDLSADGLVGSWAGAFGHTQFMPSTYARIAVDFDGDGRRDLVGSVPDALASTANYLRRAGWRPGQPWGHEVRLPDGFDASVNGRQSRRPLSHWVGRGVVRADGQPLAAADTPAALLLPAGREGPAFLVFKNYDAIYSYNAAESYALAIALLADRLRGGDGLQARWPTDDPGLSRAERRELQALLVARGHDIGAVDGMIGARSRAALAIEQARLGREADGRAGQAILAALRSEAAAPAETPPAETPPVDSLPVEPPPAR
ncbi:MAG TPA: lytic murein transglycosylase [Arenimonas sp.]|uniref:lytic murein transglycosylase n=1 Tax=Arenimonas sp. TaxID=1872635 RepID=UPI002D8042AF|nr:lytic murein transglycosylase [Arenimonas sp.]HEU0151994.1 lytic murein transglycosylase [Arenimonas sp.]